MNFTTKKCTPCEVGTPPMNQDEVMVCLKDLKLDWELSEKNKKITYEFKFKDFREAMIFVNKVADIAEAEKHHPNICIFYHKVRIELSTHAVSGLTENDFILAAKIEKFDF